MSIKLTDAQLLMLSAAARREDRILATPPNLKGAAAQKVAAKLVAAGLVKETSAARTQSGTTISPFSPQPNGCRCL
jgi:cytochrome c-type biogenesis protein CcmE